MATVRVGIVSWNTAVLLDRCLAALPAALGDIEAEVVVVDNASSDESASVAEAHPGVTVIRSPENVGYAKGMNAALAGSTAPVLIAINPDTEPPPDSLRRLVAHLLDDPGVGLLAPRLENPDGSLQHSVYRFPSLAAAAAVCLLPSALHRGAVGRRFFLEGHTPHEAGDVDWAIGAVHCIRAAAVDRAAPYRERWFMYVEDLDLCWRLHRTGWRVALDASVSIPHVGNAAGAQAWGPDRIVQWLEATHDWYVLERGPSQARLWAAINLVGVALDLAVSCLLLLLGPDRGGARRPIGDLRRMLAVNARWLLKPRGRVR